MKTQFFLYLIPIFLYLWGLYQPWMPGFFKLMPKNDDKIYRAIVIKTHYFREEENGECYSSKPIKGIRRAYIKARFMALWYDMFVVPGFSWRGVMWAVKEIKE